MSEWTYFTATITIENRGELNPMFYLKKIETLQQKVESGEKTWDDIWDEYCDSCNTAPAWKQMIQHCFIPNEHKRDRIPDISIDISDIEDSFTIDIPPCPFRDATYPLGHINCSTRFYQNMSPDGTAITFSYEGEVEECLRRANIEKWVKNIRELFFIRSGVVVVRNDIYLASWNLGRVRDEEKEEG